MVITSERPPLEEVASDCEATVLPLSEVIVPPAPPASVPHTKAPPFHSNFSVDALHALKPAPKRVATARLPVEVAFPSVVFPETVSAVLEAKPRVEVPVTLRPLIVTPPVKVGFALKTAKPVPVSSLRSVASSLERSSSEARIIELSRYADPMVVDAEITPLPFDARTPPVVLRVSALMRAFVAVRPVVDAYDDEAKLK